MADALRLVEVATMDERRDELIVIRIPQDAVPAARERGWMVFDDFAPMMAAFNRPRLKPEDDAA